MLERRGVYLRIRRNTAPEESSQLEEQGFAVLRGVLAVDEIAALKADLERVYRDHPADLRNVHLPDSEREDFRYQMFNRSALARETIAHPRVLEVVEPLLGEDCHVIANTCWRNPPRSANQHGGGAWHIDAGPHIPRPAGVPWDDRIPYPIFAIGAHFYVQDCGIESGPTGVLPGSHKSGQSPPGDRIMDTSLTWEGRSVLPMLARAGDVALFVSDVWHRRLPAGAGDQGRFFLQCHYGRRDLAQRVRTTAEANQVDDAKSVRERGGRMATLLGLHNPLFYDG
jgi:ectoine hydroxylase-related dioxygenase (phytanoyl-CoA dioxygenase family)